MAICPHCGARSALIDAESVTCTSCEREIPLDAEQRLRARRIAAGDRLDAPRPTNEEIARRFRPNRDRASETLRATQPTRATKTTLSAHSNADDEGRVVRAAKMVGYLALFIACFVLLVRLELRDSEAMHPPLRLLPPMPTLPERLTHPDASPEECARVRALGGECASYSIVRTCDDAGVLSEERCGFGAWPCVRDGCGQGVRCCVPGSFDAGSTWLADGALNAP